MTTPTSPVPATKAPGAQHATPRRPETTAAPNLPVRGRVATRIKWVAGIAAVVLATWWVVQQMPPGSGDVLESQSPEATAPPVLAGMTQFEIVPEAADLVIGDSIVMGMSGRGGDGQAGDSTARTVRWESSDPSVATVSAAGMVAAVAEGIARVTATSRGYSATAIVRVRRAPTPAPTQVVRQRILASVIVSPAEVLLTPGAF